jgi:hypothetical protein
MASIVSPRLSLGQVICQSEPSADIDVRFGGYCPLQAKDRTSAFGSTLRKHERGETMGVFGVRVFSRFGYFDYPFTLARKGTPP